MWHDPDDRLQKAVDRFEGGDVEAARAMLRGLERQGVVSPKIDLYLGHCHLDDDRPHAALRRYRRVVDQRPDESGAWVGIALCHGRLGQVDRALDALQRAVALDPEREDVHCHLVHCYALLGRLPEAESHARRARQLDPSCPHVHRHLALAYLLADRPAAALACWDRVLARDPEHAEAPLGRARCLAALERRVEARALFVKALSGPYVADAHHGLGELALAEERHEAAVRHFRNAAAADPEHVEARLGCVRALSELGRFDDAWQALLPALDAHEDDPDVVATAARLLALRRQRRAALARLKDLVRRCPASSGAWRRLGEHLLAAGRVRAALPALRRSLRREATDADAEPGGAARALARALARRGRPREAVRTLARAAYACPGSVETQLDLAAAQIARGRPESAEAGLLHALVRVPGEAALWAAAAELAFEGGRLELARERLRWALRCNPRSGHALALLVRWLLARGEHVRAVNAARAALRVVSAGHPVGRDLGRALLHVGRAEEALLPLRRYVLASPSDPDGYRLLAHALDARGDARGAEVQRRLLRAVSSVT
jgi:tetratricopeptide (TPR) repeat protein